MYDTLCSRDPKFVIDYTNEIYQNLRVDEMKSKITSSYLKNVQNPKEIKDTSRAFLIEWVIDVNRKFRTVPETLYVTVYIVDRYLSLKPTMKSQLHILAVASLLIASKYEEIYPPEMKDFLNVSENKFSRDQVLDMEQDILVTLQFELTTPSAYRFL